MSTNQKIIPVIESRDKNGQKILGVQCKTVFLLFETDVDVFWDNSNTY